MEYTIRPVLYIDKPAVVDIFNHYVENTYAAYPRSKVPYAFFDLLKDMANGYPFYVAETSVEEIVPDSGGRKRTSKKVIGYALLRPHYRMDTFAKSAELTCFIAPGYTGKGVGRALLDRLFAEAKPMGIDTILASISSANPDSIKFHIKYGFLKCGEFKGVGKKLDKTFDEVWMQLSIGK
jgi:L-amino acid N-acyltransferase YncA